MIPTGELSKFVTVKFISAFSSEANIQVILFANSSFCCQIIEKSNKRIPNVKTNPLSEIVYIPHKLEISLLAHAPY